ncbi:hypothetical protein HJC23_003849 [Cyclotella cryptica]|uniref:RING-type domain-containing protein n=1 Tax=Cyclotella cryptica TaxID=29204 RepID=A0ABD3Q086_9STRA|eukprot:CCRYP_010011-RA/>CCRYP_010011-RA protein AED:0.10 eAED:0.03 QI:0/-1/0/1/-1/1/1/0/210
MGLTQTKLHWAVLEQDWKRTLDRLSKRPQEAFTANPYGDLPIHLACYGGQAPPYIIRALIEAHPNSLRMENKAGRDPLELASINYSADGQYRSEVLALLRWHRPGHSLHAHGPGASIVANNSLQHQLTACSHLFSQHPPKQLYHTSPHCVVCLESPVSIALIPCGHLCLCIDCVQTTVIIRGVCPVDRCEVESLYKVREDGDSGAMLEAS